MLSTLPCFSSAFLAPLDRQEDRHGELFIFTTKYELTGTSSLYIRVISRRFYGKTEIDILIPSIGGKFKSWRGAAGVTVLSLQQHSIHRQCAPVVHF
jgi:hypothetical protein